MTTCTTAACEGTGHVATHVLVLEGNRLTPMKARDGQKATLCDGCAAHWRAK